MNLLVKALPFEMMDTRKPHACYALRKNRKYCSAICRLFSCRCEFPDYRELPILHSNAVTFFRHLVIDDQFIYQHF
jgi:hypothetical protein